MKNIHVLPTNKPSRLWLSTRRENYLMFDKFPREGVEYVEPQNIYITSDEKPKQREWSLYHQNKIHKCIEDIIGDEFKKIILTTDQELINDGVQAIDDEFLEWFVKNPSCEEVEVETDIKWKSTVYDQPDIEDGYIYKLIIPQEEPKFRFDNINIEEPTIKEIKNHKKEPKQERVCNCGLKESEHNVRHPFIPKQETLEEAGKNTTKKYINEREKQTAYLEFIEGAKWQQETLEQVDWKAVYEDSLSMQKCSNAGYESKIRELESKIERMYNEEEARAIWKAGKEYWKTSGASITFEELIEQFKKK